MRNLLSLVTATVSFLCLVAHDESHETNEKTHHCIHSQLESLLQQHIYQTTINYPIDWINNAVPQSTPSTTATTHTTPPPSNSNNSFAFLRFEISSDDQTPESPLDSTKDSRTLHTIDRSSTHSTKSRNINNNPGQQTTNTHNRRVK